MKAKIPKIDKLVSSARALGYKTGVIQHAPQILVVSGIISIGVGVVCACKATLKADEILDEAKEQIDKIHDVNDRSEELAETTGEVYTEKDMKKDLVCVYVKTGVKFVKAYLPAVIIISAGIGLMCKSNSILAKRYFKVAAAYETLKESYERYRKNVRLDLGEEKDRQYALGLTEAEKKIESIDEKGNKVIENKNEHEWHPDGMSKYAVLFSPDTTPACFRPNDYALDHYSRNNLMAIRERNKTFLYMTETELTKRLRKEGILFLNDVYAALGFDPTEEGCVVGWVYPTNEYGEYCGPGEGRVDFRVFDFSSEMSERREAFRNCSEDSIWLDFNVDGIVSTLLPKNQFFRKKCG